ncbi:YdeI/OmpD-associated family protein [Nocardia sp. NPDC046763]|uniref:YdeI/OmpD-associated family protein n=1 Tax=Nocardia sp. NPDC046763 TaxID=3155256 RepID=UPI003409B5D5
MSASERPTPCFPDEQSFRDWLSADHAARARHPEAAACFATLPMRSRIAVGYHLGSAVRPEARARRLEQVIRKLIDGKPL